MVVRAKHILITGGASGVGLELVKQLYEHNRISVIARPSSGLNDLRRTFERITVYQADLSDIRAVEKAADDIVKADEKVDILINNAAVQHTPLFIDENFRYETIKHEIDVNFTSICCLIHLLLPVLLQDKPSTILTINSGLGFVPKTSSAVYCATKGALNIFSQSLRHQLEHTNIGVKQVFLPLVDTEMTRGRGTSKLSADEAATKIIDSLGSSRADVDIGKVRFLRLMTRVAPSLARRLMKAG